MWNPRDGEAPPNFLAALYGDEDGSDEEYDGEMEYISDDEVEPVYRRQDDDDDDDDDDDADDAASSPEPPSYSPLTVRGSSPLAPLNESRAPSPRPVAGGSRPYQDWTRASRSRSRSRSPLYEAEPYQDWTRASRSRSRSPILETEPLGVVLAIYDEDGNEFFVPDSHALYERVDVNENQNENMNVNMNENENEHVNENVNVNENVVVIVERGNRRGRSLSGRVRGRRTGRVGRRVGGRAGIRRANRGREGGRRRQEARWQPGQPLEEVWLTDDDVSPELREMVTELLRKRQARLELLEARRMRARRNAREARREEQNSESEDDDVFEDALDGRDNPLLEGVDPRFDWSPMETFRGVEESFVPERTGSVSSYTTPYDAFRSYWDDGIIQTIVDETNRYASRIPSASFQSQWHPTNAHEILCLFAFWMMTGVIRMPTIGSYFSNNSLLKTDVFSRITTLQRYTNLTRALHFVDTSVSDSANPTNTGAASLDRLYRLRPIIDHLNSKYQSNYVLSQNICIDESLTLWKGRLQFKQYIRSKAAKFGIKTFELCESATGYLWSFVVYTGKQTSTNIGLSKSTAIVLQLIEPLLNKGYRLFMDNWFNSPLLARCLKRNRTDCVGTLRSSRVEVPRIVTHAPLKQGQLVARHSGDVCVLSWMDKKRINMISTCHGSATGLPNVSSRPPLRPEQYKPQAVLDYNRYMGGVDLKDQMLEPYLLERKRCAKWYLKLFKRMLNTSIQNSRILLESSLKARQDNLQFRLELVHAILCHHHSLIPLSRRRVQSSNARSAFPHVVLHTHWPIRIPQTPTDLVRNRQSRQKCVFCLQEGRKLQRTPFQCEDCNVPLCVENCFKNYHTSIQ